MWAIESQGRQVAPQEHGSTFMDGNRPSSSSLVWWLGLFGGASAVGAWLAYRDLTKKLTAIQSKEEHHVALMIELMQKIPLNEETKTAASETAASAGETSAATSTKTEQYQPEFDGPSDVHPHMLVPSTPQAVPSVSPAAVEVVLSYQSQQTGLLKKASLAYLTLQ